MIAALASPSSASELWYLTRGTGTVALLLLTAVLVLGVMARGGHTLPGSPRFVTPALHRNLALLTVSMLAVHIITAVADPFAPIRLADAVLPFRSAYRPIWVGLGALAFDLLIALTVTSLLRARIGQRVWRTVHWLAYGSWPVAVAHGLGTGSDVKQNWLLALTILCAFIALAAVLWRILRVGGPNGRQKATAVGLVFAVIIGLAAWVEVGPLAPHWAARAGTPSNLLASTSAGDGSTKRVSPALTAPAPHGNATIRGQAQITTVGSQALVVIAARLRGGPGGRLRITLQGQPDANQGVTLSTGSVTYSSRSAIYSGPVTGLTGGQIAATLSGSAGRLRMIANLSIDASQAFTGTVTMS